MYKVLDAFSTRGAFLRREPMSDTYSVSLVQVSDIHWEYSQKGIFEKAGNAVLRGAAKDSLRAKHQAFMKHLREVALECSRISSKTILILGGDHVFKGNYELENISTLHHELVLPIARLSNDNGKAVFDAIVAVPGNHDIFDINRAAKKAGNVTVGGEAPPGADKFFRFAAWTALLRSQLSADMKLFTPFSEAHFRLLTPWNGSILFWAINSASKCGSLDWLEDEIIKFRDELTKKKKRHQSESSIYEQLIDDLNSFVSTPDGKGAPSYDPGYVDSSDMETCEKFIGDRKDELRVGLLHHNNLPTVNDDAQQYRFLNAGAFNNFLLHNRFRLLLHGHQHLGEHAEYSKLSTIGEGEQYAPHFHNGFLAVGAPAFDIGAHNSDHRGFNAVRIQMERDSDLASIFVDKHLWHPDGAFAKYSSRTDIAIRPARTKERIKCLQDVKRILYSNAPIRGIARGLDDHTYRRNHGESLRIKVKSIDHVHAIYAVSAFSPGYWLSSKIIEFLYPFGQRNIIRAAKRFSVSDKAADVEGLTFQFSLPLLYAVRRAAENADLLSGSKIDILAHNLKHQHDYCQAHDFVSRRIACFEAGIRQMSRFGQAVQMPKDTFIRNNVNSPIYTLEQGIKRPSVTIFSSNSGLNEGFSRLYEFPRIVLWEDEDFMRPSALDIIEFHESMGFPLFWLPIGALRSREGVVRRKLGYVSILGYDPSESDDKTADEHLHNPTGEKIGEAGSAASVLWSDHPVNLWKLDKDEMGISAEEFNHPGRWALHEFIWLLGHPSICFAADAWTARYVSGKHFAEFKKRLMARLDY